MSNVDVLNLTDYKTLINEINPSYLATANNAKYTGINTNWQEDEILRTGLDQNYNFSYAGGTDKVRFYSALGYQLTEGIINPSKYNRFSGKINVNANLTSWLKTDVSLNIIQSDGSYISDNNSVGQGGAVMSALVTPAFLPIWGSQLNVRDTNPDGAPAAWTDIRTANMPKILINQDGKTQFHCCQRQKQNKAVKQMFEQH